MCRIARKARAVVKITQPASSLKTSSGVRFEICCIEIENSKRGSAEEIQYELLARIIKDGGYANPVGVQMKTEVLGGAAMNKDLTIKNG